MTQSNQRALSKHSESNQKSLREQEGNWISSPYQSLKYFVLLLKALSSQMTPSWLKDRERWVVVVAHETVIDKMRGWLRLRSNDSFHMMHLVHLVLGNQIIKSLAVHNDIDPFFKS